MIKCQSLLLYKYMYIYLYSIRDIKYDNSNDQHNTVSQLKSVNDFLKQSD